MFKLDDNLLIELGLGALPPAEKNRMLRHIYETLEMRVGMKLAQRMTNEQLDEFEAFINRNDEAGALKWLESNFPNYKQVVADELEALKTEIKTAAPQIVASSQQQQALQPQQPAPANPATIQQPLATPQPQYPYQPAPSASPVQGAQPQPTAPPQYAPAPPPQPIRSQYPQAPAVQPTPPPARPQYPHPPTTRSSY